ncbi:hypothetical protein MJT46_005802 [Ovis ammon polii x Ovis aries]|nr:hypothetical protein MJT46_005802 [Ovis ammon polii x Ovis aries]
MELEFLTCCLAACLSGSQLTGFCKLICLPILEEILSSCLVPARLYTLHSLVTGSLELPDTQAAKKDMVPKSPQMSLNSSFILHKCTANPVLRSSAIRPCLILPPSAPVPPGLHSQVAISKSSSLILSFATPHTTLVLCPPFVSVSLFHSSPPYPSPSDT